MKHTFEKTYDWEYIEKHMVGSYTYATHEQQLIGDNYFPRRRVLQPEALCGASQAGALPRGLLLLMIIIIILLLLIIIMIIMIIIIIIIMIMIIMINTKDRIAVNMGGDQGGSLVLTLLV